MANQFLDYTGLVVFKKGCDDTYCQGFVKNFYAESGTAGYVKLCTISVENTAYADSPVVFFISERNIPGLTTVSFSFQSTSSITPSAGTAYAQGKLEDKLVYSGQNGSYDIWYKKDAYGQIGVYCPLQNTGYNPVTITWKGDFQTSKPAGAVSFQTGTITTSYVESLF